MSVNNYSELITVSVKTRKHSESENLRQADILNSVQSHISCQGRSDGGIWVFIPPKSVQVNFLWGKNDVRTAIEQFYTPKNFYTPQNKFQATPRFHAEITYGNPLTVWLTHLTKIILNHGQAIIVLYYAIKVAREKK